MAGDWIKMRTNLWDHPKVVRIVSALCPQSVHDMSARCRVIGALYRTWALADAFTEDGTLDGYTAEALNAAVGIEGWAENLQRVGWLVINEQSLMVPRFEDHNGQSAKRRAEDAKRKRIVRKSSAKCPQRCGHNADQRREEKRREDIDNTPPTPQGATGLERPPVADASQDEPPGEPLDTTGRTDWRQPNRPGPSTVPEMVPIPDALDTPEFRHAWSLWLASYREHHGRYPPQTSLQMTLVDLALAGVKDATERTLYTAKKGYKGIVDRVPPEAKQPARTPFMGLTEDDLREFR